MPDVSDAVASSGLLSFTERGSGPPLLLVHGLMITGEMFAPVIDQFAARHRVIVPDLRGHGRSRGLPPPYSAKHLASDLARLLDHLAIDSTAVLGYSQGGAIAQQLALDHPTRCDRLVLACTYAFNMATVREKVEGHLVPLLLDALGMRRFARLIISQELKRRPGPRRMDHWAHRKPGSQGDGGGMAGSHGVRQQASPCRDPVFDPGCCGLEGSGSAAPPRADAPSARRGLPARHRPGRRSRAHLGASR